MPLVSPPQKADNRLKPALPQWPWWLGLAVLALLLVGFHLVDPREHGILPPCLFHKLTGWYCAGCGSGRALAALATGDVLQAFAYNPLFILALGLIPLGLINALVGRHGKPALGPKAMKCIGLGLVVAAILFWIARNLPIWPFGELAPRVLGSG